MNHLESKETNKIGNDYKRAFVYLLKLVNIGKRGQFDALILFWRVLGFKFKCAFNNFKYNSQEPNKVITPVTQMTALGNLLILEKKCD